MNHSHDHCQGHTHNHAPADFSRAFAIGAALNLIFVLVESGYGIASNSLALVADAGHNLSDVMTLLLAWGAMLMARRGATALEEIKVHSGSRYAPEVVSACLALFNKGFMLE